MVVHSIRAKYTFVSPHQRLTSVKASYLALVPVYILSSALVSSMEKFVWHCFLEAELYFLRILRGVLTEKEHLTPYTV